MNPEKTIGDAKSVLNTPNVYLKGQFKAEDYKLHLSKLESVREPLLSLRVERYKDLCKRREQYRHPKDKDYTDFDRRTMLEAAVADVVADYELVAGLEKLVAERVDLIKLLLKEK